LLNEVWPKVKSGEQIYLRDATQARIHREPKGPNG